MQIVNVTDIKIKTGVTKTGAKAGEPWELIIIVGEDGSEFTTFDKAAKEVGIGGILELEPVIKAGKTNFTKFTIKKKGQAPVASTNGGKADMTTEMWDEKQRIERDSIESQTRAERITELLIAGQVDWNDKLGMKLRTWLEKLGTSVGDKKAQDTTEDLWPKDPPNAARAAKEAEEAAELRLTGNVGEPPVEPIDPDWLKESLVKAKFTERTAVSWILMKFKVQGGLLKDVLPRLTKEQQREFVKEIEDRMK